MELVEVTDDKVVHSDKMVTRSLITRPNLQGPKMVHVSDHLYDYA